MSNTVSSALNPEMWTNRLQIPLTNSLVALEICDTTLQAELKVGDRVNFPYMGTLSAEDYTPGTALTAQDISATIDYIDVTTYKAVPFYIDDVRELQAKPDYAGAIADDAAYHIKDAVDATALAQVSAGIQFGDSTASTGTYITGAATTAIAGASGTITKVFTDGRRALREENVEENGDWIAIMEPGIASLIELIAIGSGFNVADSTLHNGYAGTFLGFKIYVSNNITADHMFLGRRGSISLIIQSAPKMEIKDVSDKLGKNFIAWTVFGVKTFTRNASRFLDVDITI